MHVCKLNCVLRKNVAVLDCKQCPKNNMYIMLFVHFMILGKCESSHGCCGLNTCTWALSYKNKLCNWLL